MITWRILDIVESMEDKLQQEKVQKILSWLSPVDFAKQQAEIFERRVENTGTWFLNSEKFKEWKQGGLGVSRNLWCYGGRKFGACSL